MQNPRSNPLRKGFHDLLKASIPAARSIPPARTPEAGQRRSNLSQAVGRIERAMERKY